MKGFYVHKWIKILYQIQQHIKVKTAELIKLNDKI